MSTLATDTYDAGIPRSSVYADGTSTSQTAVSWPAIFAGAAAAAALSLILLILGVGLGLSSVSPWSGNGVSAETFGISTIIWLTLTQALASGFGGYLAGRLRIKWTSLHGDEVYFRDTAHGLLAWAVATLVTAAVLGSAITSVVGGGFKAGASLASGVGSTVATAASAGAAGAGSEMAKSGDGGNSMGYFVDSLFRKPDAAATPNADGSGSLLLSSSAAGQLPAQWAGEVSRILANSIENGSLAPEDQHYLGTLVAQRAGISQQDAEKRVTDTFNKVQAKLQDAKNAAKDAADKARKASSYAALWLFISLLFGAFVASLMATFGGRQRDFY